MEEDYLDLVRRCATIISKSKSHLEIIDSTTFETLKATVDETMFSEASVNDHVTYVQTDVGAKVLEVRKS